MGHIQGANRHEEIQFPERLDDYIAEENPVRFIDAFIDDLNLAWIFHKQACGIFWGKSSSWARVLKGILRGETHSRLSSLKARGARLPHMHAPHLIRGVSTYSIPVPGMTSTCRRRAPGEPICARIHLGSP